MSRADCCQVLVHRKQCACSYSFIREDLIKLLLNMTKDGISQETNLISSLCLQPWHPVDWIASPLPTFFQKLVPHLSLSRWHWVCSWLLWELCPVSILFPPGGQHPALQPGFTIPIFLWGFGIVPKVSILVGYSPGWERCNSWRWPAGLPSLGSREKLAQRIQRWP